MVFSGIRWSVMSSNEVLAVLKSQFLDAEHMIEVMNGCDESNHKPRHIASKCYLIHKNVKFVAPLYPCGLRDSRFILGQRKTTTSGECKPFFN